ncbi:MAG: hypothetical protein KBT02_12000 [Treponema sp.]|nr:hypothetical protein [Candidatus Treponema caballi]
MKIKNATILFVFVPFILGTILLVYCIWAVSTNKNYTIKETVSVQGAKLVWYTEKVKDSDVPVTRVQCIGSRKIFDPHQERYDIFIAEGAPELSFETHIGPGGDAESVTITVVAPASLESAADSSSTARPLRIIRQKTEAHGLTFIWK